MNKKQRKEAKKTVERFFTAWRYCDWAEMERLSQWAWRFANATESLEMIYDLFSFMVLRRFKIISSEVKGEAMIDVIAMVEYQYEDSDEIRKRTIAARVICEAAPYKPSLDGVWGVNPISVMRTKRREPVRT